MMMKLKNSTMKQTTKQLVRARVKAPYSASIMLQLSLIIISPISANAANFQSSETLRSTAQTFLAQQTSHLHELDTEITIGHLDRRLRLTECSTEPTAFLAPGAKLQGKLSVGLRCSGKKPWTVYIPAQIKSFANIVTAAHSLPRGKQISDSDVMITRQDISHIRNGSL